MPPMTSSRPGARLTRIGLPKSNSADSSARVRASSVGTGSRLSSASRLGRGLGAAGLGAAAGGRCGWLGARDDTRLLGLQNSAIEESPPAAQLKGRGEHVGPVFTNLIISQLKA